ncbi:MAG: cytochrome c biogenesis protein CcdA [Hyphomicrobiaceae bacterium]|nr:MAG: cytochrome c biogenesis protein CcdA [Hyphomicrobiaceae bacterium]
MLAVALLAGILSTLSPCVLPLLPVVLGSAAAEHRLAPAALASGLALSFTTIGLFVATLGFSAGIDTDLFRYVAAVLMIAIAAVLMIPALHERVAVAANPISTWMHARFGGFAAGGIVGQLALGLLLGAVWTPCVGPTLGAASLLAAQGKQLSEVALVMFVFGIGAALPLLVLGMLSREAMQRWRARAMGLGRGMRLGLGAILAVVGLAILAGLDKRLEAALISLSPDWLTRLTTSF